MRETLYNNDFQGWIEETIHHLENQQFDQLDIQNLIEELAELGRSEKRSLESNLMILIAHLLKLRIQQDVPEAMKGSWYDSVVEHRQRVCKSLRDTPSLKGYLASAIESAYPDARKVAIKEGKLAKFGVRIPPEFDYPPTCPFTLEQLLDEDFMGG
ncbi:DUF29 domain-containing protein [Synechocystis sp. LKSZ1]|uniref:DUF29 domain-containing protein n=1 Tax=Synechocystis sp. LKSZ1 TaxID=3144951 RepID=UPI00336C15C8